MREPLVSVIIPVYNGANYIREAIDSVIGQSYKNIEIIVVNDGSNDNGETEKIALSYKSKIHYIAKENGGVASALNVGISHMKGEYFAWLSHDDIFYPEKIAKQVEILEKKQALITSSAYYIFYDTGRKVAIPFVDFYGEENTSKNVFPIIHELIHFGGILLHKSIFDKYGVFREELRTTQDYEFLFRILRGEKCIYTNDLLCGVRSHEEQGRNTISSMSADRDDMYCMFISELTEDEKCLLHGSVYNFYYQILLRLMPMKNMEKSFLLCLEGLKEAEKKIGGGEKLISKPVYIYGAGAYGKRILFDLRCREIEVAGFVDGNPLLWGEKIDGMICYSPEEAFAQCEDKEIIIASLYREEIAQQLNEKGIKHFIYKEDYEKKMMGNTPIYEIIQKELLRYE